MNARQHAEMNGEHATSKNIFIRLANNGDKVVGVFCGDPFPNEVVWNGERYETFDPEIHTDKPPSLRVMVNFYVPAEHRMRVVEGGLTWFQSVVRVRDEYGLDKRLFQIERHGQAGDPLTVSAITPKDEITDALQREIAAAGLHDLAALVAGRGDGGDDDPPIGGAAASELIALFKDLPSADVDVFLEQFRVRRVSDLRVSDVEAARQLLGGLKARARRNAARPQSEVDPFA